MNEQEECQMSKAIVEQFTALATDYSSYGYHQSSGVDVKIERADLQNIKFMSNQVVHNYEQVENTFNYNRFAKAVSQHQKEILHSGK